MLIVYVFVVVPSSAVTTTFIAFVPSFNCFTPVPIIFCPLWPLLAYISTDSASFGTVTEYEVFAALNPVKSYCPFIPRFANVATLDFVCCCCVFEFEFEFEFEALFELLLFSAFFTLTVLEAKLVIVLPSLASVALPSSVTVIFPSEVGVYVPEKDIVLFPSTFSTSLFDAIV